MLLSVSVPVPEFVSVAVWELEVVPTFTFPKFSDAGASVPVAETPVPLRAIVCVVGFALSVMVTEGVAVPLANGVNVTVTVQLAPTARLVPHVFVTPNHVASVPVIVIEVKVSVAVPVFVIVEVCGALLVFTFWLPKLSEVGLELTLP